MDAPYKARGNTASAHKTSANWQKLHNIKLEMIDGISYRAISGGDGVCDTSLSVLQMVRRQVVLIADAGVFVGAKNRKMYVENIMCPSFF